MAFCNHEEPQRLLPLTSKPRLTLDVSPLLDHQWTGIPVFTRRLVQSLLRHGGLEITFTIEFVRISEQRVLAAIGAGMGAFLWEEHERNGGDGQALIDPTAHLLYPSVKKGFGVAACEASTVHDLSTLFMPENHEPANVGHHLDHFEAELASNDVIFCVSDATRSALTSAYPSVSNKARTLYQYADWPEEFALLDRDQPPLQLGRYAAVVGTIEPRKNLALLIAALSQPELKRSDIRFLVIGRKGWLVDKFLADLAPDERERLVFSGFVSEFVKYRLIKGAEFLVLPSLYEGFGIPALEAMSLGKPVLASRTSSFPEVIGDAGIFFDPLSPSDFAAAFAEIEDSRMIGELAPKAIAQAATFGWQRMAAPVVEWVQG